MEELTQNTGIEPMSFMRQTGFFNPAEQEKLQVHVFGAGSSGSNLTFALAKMGIGNITVYDYDKVERHNLPNQFFKIKQIGMLKTASLAENIYEFTGTRIEVVNAEITSETPIVLPYDSIAVFTFDNIEARKLVFNKLKEQNVTLIDVRAGGQGWSLQVVNCNNKRECEEYEVTLEGKFSTLQCGYQTVIYNVLNLASETCNTIKRLATDDTHSKVLKREMTTPLFIAKQVKK